MNATKKKLAEGKLVLCINLRAARTLDVPMVAAASGFDCLFVDLEHSATSLETTSTICIGCPGLGITPLVRVPCHDRNWISRVLDGGAQGVIVPHVNNRAEAEAVVDAARFPPLGHRSVMGATPALGYNSIPLGEVNRKLNAETLVIVMIETPDGVKNADEIAAVNGVDMLLIGSNDLCTEMGFPGDQRNPKLKAAYEAVAKVCKKHGKSLGVGGIRGDLQLQGELVALGARFIIAGGDLSYLGAAAKMDVEALRGLVKS
jgi:2-keto-3-deoxy-L-rhamnonate aldolase RhmA